MDRRISFANVDLTSRHLTHSDYYPHHPGNGSVLEEVDEGSRFLEPDHKVELEFSRNGGGLVISPSTAARLYELGKVAGDDSMDAAVPQSANSEGDKKGWKRYGGVIFGLSASFFFSLSVMMAKLLKENCNEDPLNVSVFRYMGVLVPSIPIVLYYQCISPGDRIFQTVLPLKDKEKLVNFSGLMFRGLLGCTSVLLRFYSLKYLTLADSSVISYASPVFVVILAHFCLGEKCGLVPIVVAFLTTVGVFVIMRPPVFTGEASFDSNTLIGTSLALMSMVCNSTVLILMRKIRQVHYALMLLAFGAWGVAESFVVALIAGVLGLPKGGTESVLMFLVLPLLVFLGQMSIIMAVKFDKAGPVAMLRSCDVIFSFIWQYIFLSVEPDIFSLIGAILVVSCVLVIGIRKWISTLSTEDFRRQKLSFVLK